MHMWVCGYVCGCLHDHSVLAGIEFRSLDTAASASTHWTVLLAHHRKYNMDACRYQWLPVNAAIFQASHSKCFPCGLWDRVPWVQILLSFHQYIYIGYHSSI